jgi:UDP-glucose 4-epimerase
MNKKVIVTGGAGFIGGHLATSLKENGYEVKVVDLLLGEDHDIRNLENLKNHFGGADYLFHMAALTSVPYSIAHPEETNSTNLTGTVNVLIAARDAGIKRVIFSSSAAVYGDQEIVPITESAPASPKSPYALQKLESEMYLRLFSEIYQLETVSLRYFNVYGKGQDPYGPYASVIPKFLEQKGFGKPLTIVGDGTQTRDFVHVSDVVRANIQALESSNVGKGEVMNIASGRSVSVVDVANLIGGPVEHVPPRLEIRNSLGDISLAKTLLDWQPSIKFEEGIEGLLA